MPGSAGDPVSDPPPQLLSTGWWLQAAPLLSSPVLLLHFLFPFLLLLRLCVCVFLRPQVSRVCGQWASRQVVSAILLARLRATLGTKALCLCVGAAGPLLGSSNGTSRAGVTGHWVAWPSVCVLAPALSCLVACLGISDNVMLTSAVTELTAPKDLL